jgi:hypothetical protein
MKTQLKEKFTGLPGNKKLALVILFWWVGVLAAVIWGIRKIVGTKFFKQHKKVIIPILALLLITPFAINTVRVQAERGRDYYIKTDDSVTFDCNPTYNAQTQQMACQERTLKGEFSNYSTVELEYSSTNGNKFSKSIYGYVFYTLQDIDINALSRGIDTQETITLRNTVLKETVSEQKVNVHYNLSEKDVTQIKQIYNDWKVAEEKRKAQGAADKKAQEEATRKAEEDKKTTENAEQEKETANPATPPSNPDDDLLFEAEITCIRYAETYFGVKDVNINYDQASIKRKQADGTLLIKANIADSQGFFRPEKPLGMMECTTSADGISVIGFLTY